LAYTITASTANRHVAIDMPVGIIAPSMRTPMLPHTMITDMEKGETFAQVGRHPLTVGSDHEAAGFRLAAPRVRLHPLPRLRTSSESVRRAE
jgi:hypothetical protein